LRGGGSCAYFCGREKSGRGKKKKPLNAAYTRD